MYFINWADIILKLRADATTFESNVGATSEFVALREADDQMTATVPKPACFIVPEERQADKLDERNVQDQLVQEFSTYIIVDNEAVQKSGQSLQPIQMVEALVFELYNVLVGFKPTGGDFPVGVEYVLDRHIEMNNDTLWHQVLWRIERAAVAENEEVCYDPLTDGNPITCLEWYLNITKDCEGTTTKDPYKVTPTTTDCIEGDGTIDGVS